MAVRSFLLSAFVLVVLDAWLGCSDVQGYVMCPTPVPDPHGGFNATKPANQPLYSNGTDLRYYCDTHYYFHGVRVTPVTCSDEGIWKLYGMDTTCYALNCQKPTLSNGSGVIVVGTNYSQGAIIHYECKQKGWITAEPTAVCLGPNWSNKYNPWCSPASCLDITRSQNESTIPYGTLEVLKLGAVDPLGPSPGRSTHLYGAEVAYSCGPGTKLAGVANRTCNGSADWTPSMPLCAIEPKVCYTTTKCSGGKVCCQWDRLPGEAGMDCCLPKTKELLTERFSNLSLACFNSLNDNFLPCMPQIIRCLDDTKNTACIQEWLLTGYLYGCNQNTGDFPPSYRPYSYTDSDLVKFCERDSRTLACTEFQVPYTGRPAKMTYRTCLPKTCGDGTADLQALAESTLKLRCRAQLGVGYQPFCQVSSVTLNCSNGMTATAHHYDGACSQCPPPGGDRALTQCCDFGGRNISCCLPKVKEMFDNRTPVNASESCRAAVVEALEPCAGIITDCLNSLQGTKSDYVCPSYHDCDAQDQYSSSCRTLFPGFNHSQYCQTSCSFLDDQSRFCQTDSFCLRQTCNSTDDIYQLALSDAKLICDYSKLTYDAVSCGKIAVTWDCSDRGLNPIRITAIYTDPTPPLSHKATAAIVGGVLGSFVLLAAILVFIKVVVLPGRRSLGSEKSNSGVKARLVPSEPQGQSWQKLEELKVQRYV